MLRITSSALLFLLLFASLTACSDPPPEPTPTPALTPAQAHGKQLFGSLPGNCATCHSLESDVKIVGPSLAGIATRAATRMEGLNAQQYIEMSVIKPDAYLVEGFGNLMPPNLGKQLTSDEMHDIVEFLLTLQ